MAITHRYTSAVADAGNANEVGPSEWNDNHKFDIPVSLGNYMVITNVGAAYDTVALSQKLGIVEMVMDGIDTIVFTVRVDKVGTGTQDWQLWNETDSTQTVVISDAAAAANNRYLTATASGLALTGLKRFRVRARSTNAADDPVFGGSSILFRKTT